MKSKSNRAVVGVVALALIIGAAGTLLAQPEGWEQVGQGTVWHRIGETLLVNVTDGQDKGMHKFVIKSDSRVHFMKNGREVEVFDLREGDVVTAYRHPEHVVQIITMAEAQTIKTEPAPVERSVATPAAPVAKEPMPATLPKTGSSLPLALLFGSILLVTGSALTLVRRSQS